MCRRLLRVAVGRAQLRRQLRLHSTSHVRLQTLLCPPSRSSPASGVRSGSMTSSASAASRRRCATRSRAAAIAQSFVFAGPRGVGKTTTARILARGLNCVTGPTADPCGVCDACVEIAQGRDMDVLEIDAATNTQVDKVRDVIITGLGIAPVRDRYKIFIIDEVHRLSAQSFDALLKSIEEPPPHVVFMMATTELEKVPPTIQSRSQVFELKTIGVKPIADQLQKIADAEHIQLDAAALTLLARAGDGSMRDAQSAFDQVIAFAGTTISADDVSTVLGLVAPRSADGHCRGRGARGRRRRVRARRARGRVRVRHAPRHPRAGAVEPRPAARRRRPLAPRRSRDRRRGRARAASGRSRVSSRART